jgi:hypothetical protein
MIRALLAACALTACAGAPQPPDPIGRFYHYVRSNQDGSDPEQIYQYRASATRLEVGKEKSRCTTAAFVTAAFDPARGQGASFTGGRLRRDLEQDAFAHLAYDASTRTLQANIPAMNINEHVTVAGEPYIIYDFDLADLNARFAGRPAPREDFRFAVALIWPEEGAEDLFRNLGWANAHVAGAERHLGRAARRYELSGGLNGQLWLDAREGHVLEARFAEPNHTQYSDFRLVLQRIDDNGADAWRAARAQHWEGCPAE